MGIFMENSLPSSGSHLKRLRNLRNMLSTLCRWMELIDFRQSTICDYNSQRCSRSDTQPFRLSTADYLTNAMSGHRYWFHNAEMPATA